MSRQAGRGAAGRWDSVTVGTQARQGCQVDVVPVSARTSVCGTRDGVAGPDGMLGRRGGPAASAGSIRGAGPPLREGRGLHPLSAGRPASRRSRSRGGRSWRDAGPAGRAGGKVVICPWLKRGGLAALAGRAEPHVTARCHELSRPEGRGAGGRRGGAVGGPWARQERQADVVPSYHGPGARHGPLPADEV